MVMKLSVVVDGTSEEGLTEGAKRILAHIRPQWEHPNLTFKMYKMGVTNILVGVWCGEEKDQVLVRVYGNNTHLFIDRQQEINTMKAVQTAGCGPEVFAAFTNGLCYAFTPGVVLSIEDVTREAVWRANARQMATHHRIKVGGLQKPMLFTKLRHFLLLLPPAFTDPKKEKRLEEADCTKESLVNLTDELEVHLEPLGCPVVFCHNDLVMRNIIWDEDSESVSFIDFEYSAPNYQPFDIANHFSEYCGMDDMDYSLFPSVEARRAWLKCYLAAFRGVSEEEVEEKDVDLWMAWVSKFTLASHLFWGVWGFLQACHSVIDFDYVRYGIGRLTEYRKNKQAVFSMDVQDASDSASQTEASRIA